MRNIRLLTWFNFFTDLRLYAPIAIIYFSQVTGSYALGMSIFSIVFISSALFELPTGIISDYVGRKKTLILGAFAAVMYSIFYASADSYTFLIIGAIIEGLSRSFYSGNNDALLYDTLKEKGKENEYEEYMGKTHSMFQIAAAICALIGGVLATWSFPLVMWLSVLSQLGCFIISILIIPPKVETNTIDENIFVHLKDAIRKFIENKKLRLLSLSSILGFGFGEASYQFQSAFYSTLWPVWAIGIAKTLSSIGATISFRLAGKINNKYGSVKILLITNIYNRIINFISALFPSIFSPILMSSTSLLFGVSYVAENSLMQKEFTDKQRATMQSLDSFFGSIFFGIVSFGIGLIADTLSPAYAIIVIQFCMLPTLIINWLLVKNHNS